MQYNAMQCNAMQYNVMQCIAVKYMREIVIWNEVSQSFFYFFCLFFNKIKMTKSSKPERTGISLKGDVWNVRTDVQVRNHYLSTNKI
jgi:hypothetical protein